LNVSSSDHHIRVISEGSCDTEDWSNDAEHSALISEINYTSKHIQTENGFSILQFFRYWSNKKI